MADEPVESTVIKTDPEVEEVPLGRRQRVEIRINSIRRSTYYSVFSASLAWLRVKLKTRVTWVVIMLFLGTADVMLNWINFANLMAEDQAHGLIIGPPPPIMWISLLVFTIIGTVLYIPETLNTLSVFCYDGQTRVLLTYEMLVTIPLEHIPISAVNYFISHCQKSYGSLVQTYCGACSIVFYFIRLVWFAHMEGKILKANEKAKVKKLFFMICCALYACGMGFPILNWRADPAQSISEKAIKNISIYLMKAPMLDGRGHDSSNIDFLLEQEGRPTKAPYLVHSIVPIYNSGMQGYSAVYKCDHSAFIIPMECRSEHNLSISLCFKFVYASRSGSGPYGQIWYNFAQVHNNTCTHSERDLQDDWKLSYRTVKPQPHGEHLHNELFDPWEGTCTNPTPWYKPHIDVCKDFDAQVCGS